MSPRIRALPIGAVHDTSYAVHRGGGVSATHSPSCAGGRAPLAHHDAPRQPSSPAPREIKDKGERQQMGQG
jgi:hypothetical protein